MNSPLTRRIVLAVLSLLGLWMWTRELPVEGLATESQTLGGSPTAPLPSDYPGGMANPSYQEAARRFEQLMDQWLTKNNQTADQEEERIAAELRSQLGAVLLFTTLAIALITEITARRSARPAAR